MVGGDEQRQSLASDRVVESGDALRLALLMPAGECRQEDQSGQKCGAGALPRRTAPVRGVPVP